MMIRQAWKELKEWLAASPNPRPHDLIEFDKSRKKVLESSQRLANRADEVGDQLAALIASMKGPRTARARIHRRPLSK
jgi:hypothetical protein